MRYLGILLFLVSGCSVVSEDRQKHVSPPTPPIEVAESEPMCLLCSIALPPIDDGCRAPLNVSFTADLGWEPVMFIRAGNESIELMKQVQNGFLSAFRQIETGRFVAGYRFFSFDRFRFKEPGAYKVELLDAAQETILSQVVELKELPCNQQESNGIHFQVPAREGFQINQGVDYYPLESGSHVMHDKSLDLIFDEQGQVIGQGLQVVRSYSETVTTPDQQTTSYLVDKPLKMHEVKGKCQEEGIDRGPLPKATRPEAVVRDEGVRYLLWK